MKKHIFILIISVIFLMLLYAIFPKYHFLLSSNILVIRCNKITGKIDYFNLIEEFKKQHPVIDFRPSGELPELIFPPESPKNE